MPEESNNHETIEEGKEEKIMEETLRARTRRKIGQIWKKHGRFLAMAFVGVMGVLIGANFWMIRSAASRLPIIGSLIYSHSESAPHSRPPRKAGPDGCELYPNDPVCKVKDVYGARQDCFVPRGSQAPKELNIPFACRNLGPFGVMDIEDLRQERTAFKPIIDIPTTLKPYYESANTQLSVKSALVTFMVVMKANGDNGEDALKDPSLAPVIQELSLAPDDGLTEDERKAAGQMLSIYNAFVSQLGKQRAEERQKVAKECAGYADKELIPIRCAVINSAPPAPSNPPTSL